MSIKAFEHFLNMGGYALYVWLAYGAAAIIVGWNIVSSIGQRKKLIRQLKRRYKAAKK